MTEPISSEKRVKKSTVSVVLTGESLVAAVRRRNFVLMSRVLTSVLRQRIEGKLHHLLMQRKIQIVQRFDWEQTSDERWRWTLGVHVLLTNVSVWRHSNSLWKRRLWFGKCVEWICSVTFSSWSNILITQLFSNASLHFSHQHSHIIGADCRSFPLIDFGAHHLLSYTSAVLCHHYHCLVSLNGHSTQW